MIATPSTRTGLLTAREMFHPAWQDQPEVQEQIGRCLREKIVALIAEATQDGRAYVVEQLSDQESSEPSYLGPQRVRELRYRVTLLNPGTAEIGEWVHSESIHVPDPSTQEVLLPSRGVPEFMKDTPPRRFLLVKDWGWQRER